jgi:hypothetical protein
MKILLLIYNLWLKISTLKIFEILNTHKKVIKDMAILYNKDFVRYEDENFPGSSRINRQYLNFLNIKYMHKKFTEKIK